MPLTTLVYVVFPMVLPIVVGIGATVLALTGKATFQAVKKYQKLTPIMIANINHIKLTNFDNDMSMNKSDPRYYQYTYLKAHYPNSGFKDPMTEQEALLTLGIEGDDILRLDDTMVRDKYRRLMMLNHPDKGGSQYLTQKLNQAKEILQNSYMIKKRRR